MKTVVLNENMALVVMRLIDQAVRAGGLETAAVALPIAQEIETQLTKD
jgi:hypothetical protein